jgi:hypothetical protein
MTRGPTKAVPPIPLANGPRRPSPDSGAVEVVVRRWVEQMTGMALHGADLCAALRSGIELCTLLNRIRPDLIKKINRVSQRFLELENIGRSVIFLR